MERREQAGEMLRERDRSREEEEKCGGSFDSY
jgi:hypothetical protein